MKSFWLSSNPGQKKLQEISKNLLTNRSGYAIIISERKKEIKKMAWAELTETQKKECYKSYVEEVIYEFGDHAKYMTYVEWCKESEKIGEPLI